MDIKLLGSLNRDDLKKLCGDSYPEWISFPLYEQVIFCLYFLLDFSFSMNDFAHAPCEVSQKSLKWLIEGQQIAQQ